MLSQLSPTVHVDPTAVIGIVRNRSESHELRETRLYLHDGRTVTVDRDPADVFAQITVDGNVTLLTLGSAAWFKPEAIIAIVENRNLNSQAQGRNTRLYLGAGIRSRTVTVDSDLTTVVGLVQAAQNPAAVL